MKRLILLISSLFLLSKAWAQPITFRINDGTSDPVLKERIETNLSRLLTAINSASQEGPDLTGIQLSQDAGASLRLLWRNIPFRCDEEMIVERLLTSYDGYQVRNIPIEVQVDSGNGRYQELAERAIRAAGVPSYVTMKLDAKVSLVPEGEELPDLFEEIRKDTVRFSKPRAGKE